MEQVLCYIIDSVIITNEDPGVNLPSIDVIKFLLRFRLRVFRFDVVMYPCHKVVLERAFDKLM
jgi:hypothetical protein